MSSQLLHIAITPDPGLHTAVEQHYGVRITAAEPIALGEESLVWRVDTDGGQRVLIRYPAWRSPEEMRWVFDLVARVAEHIPEAVAPLPGRNRLLEAHGMVAALFPFVPGVALDSEDAALRDQAARLLARLHRVMLSLPTPGPRPPSRPDAPSTWTAAADPKELLDAELDELLFSLERRSPPLLTGPIHGDYYSRNLLCAGQAIAGVVDWNEAVVGWLSQELAWSTWEFAQNESGDRLLFDRAEDFLAAYWDEGGPVPSEEQQWFVPLIRRRLRQEVRNALRDADRGLPWSPEYAAAEIRAFGWLR